MEQIEIRDLDGPNLFALYPVIKLEMTLSDADLVPVQCVQAIETRLHVSPGREPRTALETVVRELHRLLGLAIPDVGWHSLDPLDQHVLFYCWEWRETAMRIAAIAYQSISAGVPDEAVAQLQSLLKRDRAGNDRPLWIRNAERRIPAVGITGTNGKTTTTRTLAHIVRISGRHVGWSSTSGVYIDGEQVLEGDYTGPAGARRVLEDPDVDIAVLETARGGILLRGVAYESNDVGVFLNVSDDHLDMHGISRIETLADVKSIVVRVTKADGVVILNADDPLVLAQRERVRAEVMLISQRPGERVLTEHVRAGGRAVVRDGDSVVLLDGGTRTELVTLDHVPMTFGGRARHMVENMLAAAAAAIALGLPIEVVVEGIRSFRTDVRLNSGRLNTFEIGGKIIVVDYAHNESGLQALINLGRSMVQSGQRLRAIIGTAGDRRDSVFLSLGRIAASGADRIYIKETSRYLRGRAEGDASALMCAGVEQSGAAGSIAGLYADELRALVAAMDDASPGDVIVIMCVEQHDDVYTELQHRGAREWTGAATGSV